MDWLGALALGMALVLGGSVLSHALGRDELVDELLWPRKVLRDLRRGRNGMTVPGAILAIGLWMGVVLAIGAMASYYASGSYESCEARGGHVESPGGARGLASCEGATR